MRCAQCLAPGPPHKDGVPLFRTNPKGENGIFVCEDCHGLAGDEPVDKAVRWLVELVDEAGR